MEDNAELDWITAMMPGLESAASQVAEPSFLVDQPFTRNDVNTFLSNIYVEDTRTLVLIGERSKAFLCVIFFPCLAHTSIKERREQERPTC